MYLCKLYLILQFLGFTKDGILYNNRGEWYLYAQLIVILTQLFSPSWPQLEYFPVSMNIIALSILLLGTFRAIISLKSLGLNFSPLPVPRRSAILVTKGSYKYCRHPLYQNIILMSLGLTLFKASIIHLILFIILAIILIKKAKLEEKKLKLLYSQYSIYLSKIPAIFKGIIFLDWRV